MKASLIASALVLLLSMSSFSQATKKAIKLVEGSSNTTTIKGNSGGVEYALMLEPDDDFFGRAVIKCQANFNNTSGKKVRFTVVIAYFDAQGSLISSASQGTDLDPTNDTVMTSLAAPLADFGAWKKVTSYQLLIFTGDAK